MDDESNRQTAALRAYTDTLTATAYSQEQLYGSIIAGTLDKLKQGGNSPEQRAPTLDEIVANLSLHILHCKGGILNSKK